MHGITKYLTIIAAVTLLLSTGGCALYTSQQELKGTVQKLEEPLAIAVGMIGITVLYLAIQIVTQGVLGLVLPVVTVIFAVTRRGRFVEETS